MSILSTPVLRSIDEIGPYQVLEDLGPVPFGTAYLAVDGRSEQQVTLKVIPPSRPGFDSDGTSWDVLLRETHALARIYHRGIPPLFEISEHEGLLLVASAPVEGPTLHELMAQGRRPNRSLLVDWGCQLLEILAEAHAGGILHRHVSEEQIVVSPGGRLILLGFGLTQIHFDPLTAMPPERAAGEPMTERSDLYAVGLLLRRLAFVSGLKGRRGGGSRRRDPLLKVLARATFADPAARFQSAREMADALGQAGRSGFPTLTTRSVRSATRPAGNAPARAQPIAKLPARSTPPVAVEGRGEEQEDRKLALLLVSAALLLLVMVIVAGWLLVGGESLGDPLLAPSPAGTATEALPAAPPSSL